MVSVCVLALTTRFFLLIRIPVLHCVLYTFTFSYFHFVAGVTHKNALPLLVYQLCDALQWCLPTNQFLISLHADDKNREAKYQYMSELLQNFNVTPILWDGNFTSNFKMVHSLQQMKARRIGDNSKYIFHTGKQ